MFKTSRWKGDKNKVKAVFKFQFQASQVPQQGWETLVVSLVPVDVGRPSGKSDKVAVVDGSCQWTKPVHETVKLFQDPKSGKINHRVYRFTVSTTGSTKSGLLGEATINLADYSEALKPSSVALPLRPSNTGAILHVTLQRMQDEVEGREVDEHGHMIRHCQRRTLMSQLSISEKDDEPDLNLDGRICTDSAEDGTLVYDQVQPRFHSSRMLPLQTRSNIELRNSSSSDTISAVGSDTSSERYTPKASEFRDNRGPNTDWSNSSVLDGNMGGSTNSSGENGWRKRLQDPDVTIEQLRSDAIALARQVEISALELQTLRKQVVKESRRGQDLLKELTILKDERDALKKECDVQKHNKFIRDASSVKLKIDFEDEHPLSMLYETKQELNHEKNINANLKLQLQKTQEANAELILAVRDLDELLEKKNKELSSCTTISVIPETNKASQGKAFEDHCESPATYPQDDNEHYELEELVKEHVEAAVGYSVEKQITDLKSEVELYRKDREELEMQMEQLALDYEILKQENHDISSKLEQTQLREQLRIQYECSAHLAIINELEAQVESLEKELETQAQAFETDFEAMVNQKVEQEQRAIRAEEALKMTRMKNAGTAEQLQDEFNRLSAQISSMFHTNEKLTREAIAEARQLRLEICHLEELLDKANEQQASAQSQYHANLQELMSLVSEKTIYIDKLSCELKNKQEELEALKRSEEKRQKIAAAEIQAFEAAVEVLSREKDYLLAQLKDKKALTAELDHLRKAIEEIKMLSEEQNLEKCSLEKELVSSKNETTRLYEQLQNMQQLADQKEDVLRNLNSEMDLKFQNNKLKEKIRSQVLELRRESLNFQETMVPDSKANLKDGNLRHDVPDGPISITNDHSLEDVGSTKIIKNVEVPRINPSADILDGDNAIDARDVRGISSFPRNGDKSSTYHANGTCKDQHVSNTRDILEKQVEGPNPYYFNKFETAEVLTEMELLKERNNFMESELKDLQERYSEMSLKFAEVEGERQQLVMTIRTLKKCNKGLVDLGTVKAIKTFYLEVFSA